MDKYVLSNRLGSHDKRKENSDFRGTARWAREMPRGMGPLQSASFTEMV